MLIIMPIYAYHYDYYDYYAYYSYYYAYYKDYYAYYAYYTPLGPMSLRIPERSTRQGDKAHAVDRLARQQPLPTE